MRKKQLLKNINDLIEKNSELYNDNCLLSDKIKQNLDEINSLISENKRLNSLIEELQKELDEVKCSKLVFNEDCSFNYDDASFFDEFDREESIQNITGTTILVSDNIDTVLPVNDDKISSAASVIGKIVLECTELCNYFTENAGVNTKDLVNLALGRTEVFKSEILQLVEQYDDFSKAENEVNVKMASIREYFELLKNQI